MNSLSVVIPILNEVELVEESLLRLKRLIEEDVLNDLKVDIIILDAGSTDGSSDISKNLASQNGWIYKREKLNSPSIGRTIQLGFESCRNEYILILPIDCEVSIEGFQELRNVDSDYGGFFKSYNPSTIFLNIYVFLQNYIRTYFFKNLVWTNGIFGKSELFIQQDLFSTDGFMEDVLFSDNLKKKTKSFHVIRSKVLVSSRLYFVRKPFVRVVINAFIIALFRAGFKDPLMLRRVYRFAKK